MDAFRVLQCVSQNDKVVLSVKDDYAVDTVSSSDWWDWRMGQ